MATNKVKLSEITLTDAVALLNHHLDSSFEESKFIINYFLDHAKLSCYGIVARFCDNGIITVYDLCGSSITDLKMEAYFKAYKLGYDIPRIDDILSDILK